MILTTLERHEVFYACDMAKGWLENKWKLLGPKYNMSYYKRRKEAERHLDYALAIVDRAKKRELI